VTRLILRNLGRSLIRSSNWFRDVVAPIGWRLLLKNTTTDQLVQVVNEQLRAYGLELVDGNG
jgi:hypothetical protein